MKKLLYLSIVLGALLFSASCERQLVEYEKPADCALVSFPSDVLSIVMTEADGNKITVQLNRGNTKGAVSIPVTITDGTGGVFKPTKSTFDFADGEAVAYIDFKYPNIKEFGGEIYEIEVEVTDESQVSPSGFASTEISAQRFLTPKFIGTGTFYSLSLFEESWEQDLYNTEEAPNYYILPSCYADGVDVTFTVREGVPDFGSKFDTGVMYDPDTPEYGTYWLYPNTVQMIQDGTVIYFSSGIGLEAIGYMFAADGVVEAYGLPEGYKF